MKQTRYFQEQVLRKRPYLTLTMCEAVNAAPLRQRVQVDGRFQFWGSVVVGGEVEPHVLRVVTLDDGHTVHNAFIDRGLREDVP